jgi:hypothetical protein
VTIAATLHRIATGESREIGAISPPWKVDDGDRFVVEVAIGATVELDGRPCPSVQIGDRRGYLVDLGSRTLLGARRVTVRGRQLTETIDLLPAGGLRAIERLLPAAPEVERWMPRTRGAFWYLDVDRKPRRLLDPTRTLAFARDTIPSLEKLIRALERRPASRRAFKVQVRPFGAPPDVNATGRLLQRSPDLLLQHPEGPLEVDGQHYAPRLIAYRAPSADMDSLENRRLAAFLDALATDCRKATRQARWLDQRALTEAEVTARALKSIVMRSFLRGVTPSDMPKLSDPPVGLEATNPHYKELRRLRMIYQSRASFGTRFTDQRKHTASADQIYQAWCCHFVARLFELKEYLGGIRNSAGPAFENDEWQLYYDNPTALQSWRSSTIRPDDYRPDIVLRRRNAPNRVILIDAKYATSDQEFASGDRLKEVQSYMNAFGLRQAAILHPGDGTGLRIRQIAAHGHRLLEVSIAPRLLTTADDFNRIRDIVLSLECEFGETFPNQNAGERTR